MHISYAVMPISTAAAAIAAHSLDTSMVHRKRALRQADKALKNELTLLAQHQRTLTQQERSQVAEGPAGEGMVGLVMAAVWALAAGRGEPPFGDARAAPRKLLSKAVGNRLQRPLELQTAALEGQWIGQNRMAQPGALLLLDLERGTTLRPGGPGLGAADPSGAMGFGPGMLKWKRLLLPAQARACLNGHQSSAAPVRNGLTQRSPLSPVLRGCSWSRSRRTSTISVPHHADDTKLLVSDVDVDGPIAKAAVQPYCLSSPQLTPSPRILISCP
ncbi:hypothetical protein TSOC_001829 [Tetrabaena socialis]|uniref:Uncharacterized protein n=1 Tax=Tetrabaena socialis TaxID=47790 RepID=A0A2J8AFU8_9CHLO|nr:hypothetical protein TSOC_001829 [Tetrabaena socialis]|eukprot:PNH11397.1 hypothetical protein TSOC_001829 [Tetrabaena socialis]